ncbi:MAG: hypothetical protein PVG96_12810 [Desulfobacterales bacterium]|jgi:hypothetical protein
MNLTRHKPGVFCLTILLGFWTLISSAEAQSGFHLDLEPQRIQWSQLSFHAKNFWVEVSTEVHIRYLPASELDPVLLASPQGIPVKLKKSQAAEMTINTIIDPRFRAPVKLYNRIWFNPEDASALGRIRLRRGEDDFKKIYRFTDRGVFRHRIEPKDKGEAGLEPDKWTDVKDTFYPYDTNQLDCPGVSERSVLIYILSAAALSKDNRPLTIGIFGKRQLHRVKLIKAGTRQIKTNYILKNQQQIEMRKDSTVEALKMMITAQSIEPHLEDAEIFSFLGFHKDISIFVETSLGLPIQVSGIIPTVGKVDLKLNQVQLKK